MQESNRQPRPWKSRTGSECATELVVIHTDSVRSELLIDYETRIRPLTDPEVISQFLAAEMPPIWIERYHRMCTGPSNVLEVKLKEFTYLFDYCTELIESGDLPTNAREDRAVVAYGLSRSSSNRRDASRIRGFPGADDRGDRGHLVAHASGGGLDINVFHQDAYLNRGWSPEGKRYREMERYCAAHAGTFFFSRLIYADNSARPSEIEFGIVRSDTKLWVEVFKNAA